MDHIHNHIAITSSKDDPDNSTVVIQTKDSTVTPETPKNDKDSTSTTTEHDTADKPEMKDIDKDTMDIASDFQTTTIGNIKNVKNWVIQPSMCILENKFF